MPVQKMNIVFPLSLRKMNISNAFIDNVSHELHKGVGTVKVQAQVLTETEEMQL